MEPNKTALPDSRRDAQGDRICGGYSAFILFLWRVLQSVNLSVRPSNSQLQDVKASLDPVHHLHDAHDAAFIPAGFTMRRSIVRGLAPGGIRLSMAATWRDSGRPERSWGRRTAMANPSAIEVVPRTYSTLSKGGVNTAKGRLTNRTPAQNGGQRDIAPVKLSDHHIEAVLGGGIGRRYRRCNSG